MAKAKENQLTQAKELIAAFLEVVQSPEGKSDGCPICVLVENARAFMGYKDHDDTHRIAEVLRPEGKET